MHIQRSNMLMTSTSASAERICAAGKFLSRGNAKFWVKGVTYGAFRPDEDGNEYHDLALIESDFAQMVAHGMNTVRIPHTMPPRSLLDAASRHGLYVMVGLSAEQYAGFLIDRGKTSPDMERMVRERVRVVAGHPALLCYAVGNEIPAAIVRWIGRRRVERYIERIYRAIKAEDPDGLVTYVNYPTTEYLQLPFLDLLAFNVYLESQEKLAAYLPRLQNLAGDRPLLMAELGLDSIRNGEVEQAASIDWQVRTSFAKGCSGVFVFSWTDDWYRGDGVVEDWAFGITTKERLAKPALVALAAAFQDTPFPEESSWPSVSVIVCSFDGAATIRETLEGLGRLAYPKECFEVIVVSDGSTDQTAEIAREYPVSVISSENRGLSAARNLGLNHASGEIVAYIDDDAYPDPHWLQFLAKALMNSDHVGVGGPNIVPPEDGFIAQCVALSPGGPVQVLLTDETADHIPGCNKAFRRDALIDIGGFDEQFRIAGDDVDICWRLRERGWTLGFSAAASVWHHRRNSIMGYWKQQRGYGRAEALLEAKWPGKFNAIGHQKHSGRIYGHGLIPLIRSKSRVYHGVWGAAPFQRLEQRLSGIFGSLTLMPEWYLFALLLLVLLMLGVLAGMHLLWIAAPLLVLSLVAGLAQAWLGAKTALRSNIQLFRTKRLRFLGLTALLHFTQPLARLWGRLRYGLTIWRSTAKSGFLLPASREFAVWTEDWIAPEERLAAVETALRALRTRYSRGDEFARWDIEVKGGVFGTTRLLMAVEEHGSGNQYVRIRLRPHIRKSGWLTPTAVALLASLAGIQGHWNLVLLFGSLALIFAARTVEHCGRSLKAALSAVESSRRVGVAEETSLLDPA